MLKTKLGGALAMLLLLAAGYVAVGMLSPDGGPADPTVPAGTKPGNTVRLFVGWARPYTPQHITTHANDGRQDYISREIPALLGRWYRDYPYTPGVTYSIEVTQDNPSAENTMCQIVVAGKPVDSDEKSGVTHLTCVVQG